MSPLCKTAEFIAGYTLTERLGAGGYGEVWKADAPGGLVKAVKFVYGHLDEERAAREMKALQRIREVRHPFLLSLERIEVIDGQLVVITELADSSLRDRFDQCRAEGKEGIPRDELLVYLRDAADALDYMGQSFSLQHLDVKPENLLLLGGRVKVADFGLVKDMHDASVSLAGGLTPNYAAPEVFDGHPTLHSDQYSLATVYQEMLTGALPFSGRTPTQLAAQHLKSNPRLTPLPPADRPVIARAMAKAPDQRFPSCRALIDGLLLADESAAGKRSRSEPAGSGRAGSKETASGEGRRDTGQPSSPRRSTGRPPAQSPALRTMPLDAIDLPAALEAGEDEDSLGGAAAAAREAGPEWPLPATAEKRALEDLPAIEIASAEAGLRPVFVLGIGGTAARNMQGLRQRWSDRFGDLAGMSALGTLLIDTDPQVADDVARGSPSNMLEPMPALATPLRRPADYNEDWRKHSKWLSRRWLCNIPRSQRTEGLRPLGRLALVDHADEILAKLRSMITAIMTPEALAASAAQAGMPVREKAPLILLVASISGGTGGGMALELGYAVRKILAEQACPEADLRGILIHATPRHPSERMLAGLNACACLRELRQYSGDAGYPGDPLCQLPAFEPGVAPFDTTYLVHLGDELSDQEFEQGIDDLAEYLYLATSTLVGPFLEKCRRSGGNDEPQDSSDVAVRSFGLCRMGQSQRDLATATAELICRGVGEAWNFGADGSPAASDAQTAGTDLEQMCHEVRDAIQAELDGNAEESVARALLAQSLPSGLDKPWTMVPLSFDAALATIDDRLLPLWASAPRPSDRGTVRSTSLTKHIDQFAETWAATLAKPFVDGLTEPGTAARAADQMAKALWERFHAVEAAVGEVLAPLQQRLAMTAQKLAQAHLPCVPRPKRWAGIGPYRKAQVDPDWRHYVQLRIEMEVLQGVARLLRAIEPKLATIARQWKGFGEDLRAVAGVFVADLPTDGKAVETRDGSQGGAEAIAAEVFKDCLPQFVSEFDRQWRTELLAANTAPDSASAKQGDLRRDVADPWRRAARSKVLADLKQGRATPWLTSFVERLVETPNATAKCLQRATPQLDEFGGHRRIFVTCPAEPIAQPLRQTPFDAAAGRSTSTLLDPASDVILCCETEQVPLAQVAVRMIENRADYAKMARRLLTRVDVAW